MQIFRDDSRRRWRRLQILFGVIVVALVAVVFAFVKTLKPRPAAILAPPPQTPTSNLEETKTRAVQLAHADPRKAIDVPPGLAAVAPAAKSSSLEGKGEAKGGGPIAAGESFPTRIAFVDATEEEAIHALREHGAELTHVAIEGLHVRDAQGNVLGQLPDDALTAAKEKNVAVLEVIDDVRDDLNHPSDVTAIGSDPARARKLAGILEAKLEADGAAGLVIDLGEDDADPEGIARGALLEEIYATLKPHKHLVAVRTEGRFNPVALAKHAKVADLVIVRAYAGLDPKSSPAPLAPREWVEKTIANAAEIVPPQKLVISIATRSGAWPVTADVKPAEPARDHLGPLQLARAWRT